MKDLTEGSIVHHTLTMSAPVLALMLCQILLLLVDLYFIAALGEAAIAGVSAGANVALAVAALTQVLGVGTVALISQAAGRKDRADANRVFTQATCLAFVCGLLVLLGGYASTRFYMKQLAVDVPTIEAGIDYLNWYLPGLALQFALTALSSALRGIGIVRPTMAVYAFCVLINVGLAPIFIAGWLTGKPLGAAGAGLASSIAVAVAVALLWLYFHRRGQWLTLQLRELKPTLVQWRRILAIGLPAGGEMMLMFVYTGMIYTIIREFGATAQAGFAVGARVLQIVMLPVLAISFAAGPIAGQNFGACKSDRVRQTFWVTTALSTVPMLIATGLLQIRPDVLIKIFTHEPEVVAVGAMFLQLTSIGLIGRALIYSCSSVFQGLGNTQPSLVSSAVALTIFMIVAIGLSKRPEFQIEHIWWTSNAVVLLQAILNVTWLLRAQGFSKLAVQGR